MHRTPGMSGLPLAIGLLVLAGAAGAQKVEVQVDRDPDADFNRIRTYALLPPPPVVTNVAPGIISNPTLTMEVLGPHIAAAVERHLAARGLVPAPESTADVHVVYYAALMSGMDQTYLGEYYGYVTGFAPPVPIGLAPSTSSTLYRRGTIVVDIVQPAAKRAIWRGTVGARIDEEKDLEGRVKRINEALDRIFDRFPIERRR